jgi:hypothetical protein
LERRLTVLLLDEGKSGSAGERALPDLSVHREHESARAAETVAAAG